MAQATVTLAYLKGGDTKDDTPAFRCWPDLWYFKGLKPAVWIPNASSGHHIDVRRSLLALDKQLKSLTFAAASSTVVGPCALAGSAKLGPVPGTRRSEREPISLTAMVGREASRFASGRVVCAPRGGRAFTSPRVTLSAHLRTPAARVEPTPPSDKRCRASLFGRAIRYVTGLM